MEYFCEIPKDYVNTPSLNFAIKYCYELMDQTGLLQMKQSLEHDLKHCRTEDEVVFATMRIQIIEAILEEKEE